VPAKFLIIYFLYDGPSRIKALLSHAAELKEAWAAALNSVLPERWKAQPLLVKGIQGSLAADSVLENTLQKAIVACMTGNTDIPNTYGVNQVGSTMAVTIVDKHGLEGPAKKARGIADSKSPWVAVRFAGSVCQLQLQDVEINLAVDNMYNTSLYNASGSKCLL
jgi:hypothetical protein